MNFTYVFTYYTIPLNFTKVHLMVENYTVQGKFMLLMKLTTSNKLLTFSEHNVALNEFDFRILLFLSAEQLIFFPKLLI